MTTAMPNHSATPADIEQINRQRSLRHMNDMPYRPVQAPSGEFVTPQWGVLCSGQGRADNYHFATLAEAEAFYASEINQTRDAFRKMTIRETETERVTDTIVKQNEIVNVKKDGTIGKMRQICRIYAIVIPEFPPIDEITAELVRQGNEEPCPGLDEELDAIAADDTCVCPLCGDEFSAAAGVLVSDPSDEDGALHLICAGCIAPDPDDDASPEAVAQRDAENVADMLDFLILSQRPDVACAVCGEAGATPADDGSGLAFCPTCQARGERAAEDAAERQHARQYQEA